MSNGKGSKARPQDKDKYDRNYEKIFKNTNTEELPKMNSDTFGMKVNDL